jgi:signal recognition particle subunit SRP54
MGDILTLVEKAQANIDQKTALELEKSIRKNSFSLEDFRNQLAQIKKMGSIKDILGMIPGLGKNKALKDLEPDDKQLVKITAIIDSMTKEERYNHLIIDGRRRKRIALGSGTSVQDVNILLKNYAEIRKMMKKFNKKDGIKSMMRNFPF